MILSVTPGAVENFDLWVSFCVNYIKADLAIAFLRKICRSFGLSDNYFLACSASGAITDEVLHFLINALFFLIYSGGANFIKF